jgi:aspartyl protease family protein
MATVFMPHFIALFLLLVSGAAGAADVALIGVIGDKAAVLAVDGGDPKTVKVGQRWNGIAVISVDKERATVEIDGKRRVLARGQHHRAGAASSGRETVTLAADRQGHFIADGAVNGISLRFMVDTGASVVVLPAADAERIGVDWRKAPRMVMQTANGNTFAYLVKLDRLKLGAIQVSSIDAVVVEQGMDVALLGMSFLNRVEMRRDGPTMTLVRRF